MTGSFKDIQYTVIRTDFTCKAQCLMGKHFFFQNKWTALHWAAERGHDDIVYLLLDAGADPCKKNMVSYHV